MVGSWVPLPSKRALHRRARKSNLRSSLFEVLGFGGGDGSEEEKQRPKAQEETYKIDSPYQILGVGALTDEQVTDLAAEKRRTAGHP